MGLSTEGNKHFVMVGKIMKMENILNMFLYVIRIKRKKFANDKRMGNSRSYETNSIK